MPRPLRQLALPTLLALGLSTFGCSSEEAPAAGSASEAPQAAPSLIPILEPSLVAPAAEAEEAPSELEEEAAVGAGGEEEETQADPGTLATDDEDETMQAAEGSGVGADNPPGRGLDLGTSADSPLGARPAARRSSARSARPAAARRAAPPRAASSARGGGTVGAFDIEE